MLLGFDIGGTKCAVILGSTNEKEGIDIIDKVMLPTNICSTFFITGSGPIRCIQSQGSKRT